MIFLQLTRRNISCYQCMQLWFRNYTVSQDLPKITVPHKMLDKINKIKAKKASEKHQKKRFYKGPLIISCKRSEFNHYRGQTYSGFGPQHLASRGWKHSKSKGDHFTIHAYQGNPALQLEEGMDTFESLRVNSKLINGLCDMNIKVPTNIQALAIPPILRGKNVLCGAETGSGKTLAYLIPMIQRIVKYWEQFGRLSQPHRPYGVILVPSRELVSQIQAVADQLSEHVPFKAASFVGGKGTQKLLRSEPDQITDIIISTPGVFSKMLTNGLINVSLLQNIVLDEADTLLDDSFSGKIKYIIRKLKVSSEKLEVNDGEEEEVMGIQLCLVGATLPRDMENILKDIVPVETIEKVTTLNIHRLQPHIPQKFVKINSSDKPEELVRLLKGNVQRKVPTLVFCNKTNTQCFLGHTLTENGIPHIGINGKMPQLVRDGRFEQFQSGDVDVIVSTDIASRGLDTIRAQHVINYEMPDFMSDYIHRVGRVGRVASLGTGFALSFVTHKWDVDLLWKIEAAARRSTELHNVNANIKRKLEAVAETREFKQQLRAEDQHI